ncbi:MAG TPA: acylphosphatase [Cyclobacteriaceae bacterium]|nr:acylphosphatase [Cyclobacteriaceae bacterium]HNT49615.1 acylphosphatase [Cyclobacteriaceae bacterium]HRE67464.1 acylphosphatase [Cyclobacteriaceae bacterium]HRF33487.1 acylphosphatase [Cyclobacteriaceae bacterium]
MNNKKHLNIAVIGKVQGVYYRASTKQKADALGVKGFVRNQPDGSVYIEAEAAPEILRQFVEWCHRGSERAQVQHVEISEAPLKNFIAFEVQRG